MRALGEEIDRDTIDLMIKSVDTVRLSCFEAAANRGQRARAHGTGQCCQRFDSLSLNAAVSVVGALSLKHCPCCWFFVAERCCRCHWLAA